MARVPSSAQNCLKLPGRSGIDLLREIKIGRFELANLGAEPLRALPSLLEARLPQAGKHDVRIRRIDGDIGRARVVVLPEDLLPGAPAVLRHREHLTPFSRRPYELPEFFQ